MREKSLARGKSVSELAEHMVQYYVRDLLSVDELAERIHLAWQASMPGEAPQEPALDALARGVCSRVLCEACQTGEGWRREIAFARLHEYLWRVFRGRGPGGCDIAYEIREEVIQQTLVEILQSLPRERGKLQRPQAFLAWTRVILQRQLAGYWRQQPPQQLLSLDELEDPWITEIVDEHAHNPLRVVLAREQHAELLSAIERLRNPNYRAVLLKLYLGEMDASEVAQQLHVPVADIHLWRHRALPALHKQLNALEPQWYYE